MVRGCTLNPVTPMMFHLLILHLLHMHRIKLIPKGLVMWSTHSMTFHSIRLYTAGVLQRINEMVWRNDVLHTVTLRRNETVWSRFCIFDAYLCTVGALYTRVSETVWGAKNGLTHRFTVVYLKSLLPSTLTKKV